jgi:hypothetical protein
MIEKIGGMNVQVLTSLVNKEQPMTCSATVLGSHPYTYKLIQLGAGSEYCLDKPVRCCVYNFCAEAGNVSVNNCELDVACFALGNVTRLKMRASSNATVLLAYHASSVEIENLTVYHESQAKRVEKPWGHEIWLTGDPSELFAFKKIYIKAGNKTSLQYHKVKRETNFIVDGFAGLSYDQSGVYNGEDEYNVSTKSFKGPFVVDVFPNTLHRLDALTNITLLEVSTPELDDVIRLEDDAGRSNGRVLDEHRAR